MRLYGKARRLASGFTLIELMMVVAILGILATIAIPRYKSYLYKSKTTEAISFLSEIKSRQESYRADFGQYCAINGSAGTDWYPAARSSTDKMFAWEASPTALPGAGYRQLGVYPPNLRSAFQYQVIAGLPGTTPAGVPGYTGADFWFVSRARGDLDGDGISVLFEGYSASSGIYIDKADGWE
jgi:prepilin-type N-terminal cleavage/methylation domain-containing protein